MVSVRQWINQWNWKINSTSLSTDDKLRFRHYSVLILAGIPMIAVYAVINCLQKHFLVTAIILFLAAGLIAGWILVYRFQQGIYVYRINALLFSAVLIYIQTIGGAGGSKVLWTYTFPLIVIFLMGPREGLVWSTALACLSLFLMIEPLTASWYVYTPEFILRFLSVYIVIAALAFWLDYSRSYYRFELEAEKRLFEQGMAMFVSGPVLLVKWKNRPGWPMDYVSANSEGILGYSTEELVEGPVVYSDLIHPEERDRVSNELRESSGGGADTVMTQPYRIVRKDGSLVWVETTVSVVRDGTGRVTHLVGYLWDITKRKAYEARLKEQNDLLTTLLETIPNPVFFKDSKGIYVGCNRAFETFTGKCRTEVIGKTVHDFGPGEISNRYEEMDRRLFENPGRQTYEWQVRSEEGDYKDVIFNKSTFLDNREGTLGIIGVITDITDRKRAEKEKENLIRDLRQAMSRIKKLSGLLPICSSCKKIRDDKGYWNLIETYISDHSEAEFTHGICPECAEKLYPNLGLNFRDSGNGEG